MIKIKTLTEALLTAFVIRLLVTGASLGDSYVVASLCAVWAFSWQLEKTKHIDPSIELNSRVALIEEKNKQIESKLNAQTMTGRR